MTVIKIDNFGGEMPSVSPRALPQGQAQYAGNLQAATAEFRPLRTDRTVATSSIANPKTVYRLARTPDGGFNTDMTAGWITSNQAVSYVKGQLDDDETERTYYTFDDGSAPPRVLDAKGRDRKLGVPAPANAPGATVSATDELTPEEAESGDTDTHKAIAAAFEAAFEQGFVGNSISPMTPTASSIGWAPHGPGLPSTGAAQWNFMIPLVGGQMHASYTYMTRPEFGGRQVVYGGDTYFAVPFRLYAPVWTINATTLAAQLAAIPHPTRPSEKLLLQPEIDSIVASSEDYWGTQAEPQATMIRAVMAATNKVGVVITATSGGQVYSTQAYTEAYDKLVGTTLSPNGTATDRVAFQAVKMATRQDGTEVPTRSRYWAATDAASRSNIRADIASCVSANAQGVKSFDVVKFSDMLTADFQLLLNQHTGEWKTALAATINAVVNYCVEPLKTFFSFSNQVSLSGVAITGGDNANALMAAVAEVDQAVGVLARHYELRRGQTLSAAKNSYNLTETPVERVIDPRFYLCTYVTDWGEESAPSPVSVMVEPDQNDAVVVTCPAPPAGRNIVGVRLYRSNVGSQQGAFQYLTTLDNGPALYMAQYADAAADYAANNRGLTAHAFAHYHFRKSGYVSGHKSPDALALASPVTDAYWSTPDNLRYTDNMPAGDLQEVCPTLTWAEPPEKLRGLVGMPNGIMAGFDGNTVAFCEPYKPYAWPVEYQLTTEHPIVGLGVFGQTLFVGTRGNPYFISGSDSASMSAVKLGSSQACVSRQSIATMPEGVMYASPDGLCLADQGGVRCITDGSIPGSQALWTAEDWSDNVLGANPESLRAVAYEGLYVFFWDNGTASGCYALGRGKLVRLDIRATAFYVDAVTDTLYLADGTAIVAAFSAETPRTGAWKSKKLVLPAQQPMAWAKVEGDFTAPVTLRWSADGALRHTAVFSSLEPQRLPPGRWLEHEIEIESAGRVTSVTLAGPTQELQAV